ncbi:MAG: hypothetical protein ACETWT_07385 [Thermodesulfobacteriota bacterium]
MLTVTFIIAIIALIISILAYRRAGGARELKKTVDSLSSSMESLKDRAGEELRERVEHLTSLTESLKEKTADAIDRVEKAVRGKPEEKPPGPKRSRPKKE